MSLESLQIEGIIPMSNQPKKWNAKDKNCSKCDEYHVCVECICHKCHTVDLDTMICGCKPTIPESWEKEFKHEFCFTSDEEEGDASYLCFHQETDPEDVLSFIRSLKK